MAELNGASTFIYPLVAGVVGIVVWHLIPARSVNTRLLVQIAFFFGMSAMLIDEHIVPYEATANDVAPVEAILVGSVRLLWWLHLAWALIGFVRIYLVVEGKPREARLLQDLVVGVVYAGMLLSILAFVFAVPVGTLIATSGVVAIIIGLALQNTLGDLFSGIALGLGRPFVLGDWIILSDGTEGRIVETNWRSTHLLTFAHNVVAMPNSLIAKLGLTNASSPDESHGLSLKVRVAPTRTPAAAADIMQTALLSCGAILTDPPPLVAIIGIDAIAIELELNFRVSNHDRRIGAKNELFDLVYRHCRASGLRFAAPSPASIGTYLECGEGSSSSMRETAIEIIRAIPIFSALTDDEQKTLAAAARVRTYGKDQVIARQGQMLTSLMIIRTGVIARQINDDGARSHVVGHLSPGDFFGETGLLAGIGETSTLRATNHVAVYEIDQNSIAPLLLQRPELAEELAAVLSARISNSGGEATTDQHLTSKFALLNSIREVFRAHPLGVDGTGV